MENINTFDDAGAATEEMFKEDEQLSMETPSVETSDEGTKEEQHTNEPVSLETENVLDKATKTATVAAEKAAEVNNELVQARQEIEMLRQQNSQLQGTVEELSKQNLQHVVKETLKPPTLDLNSLAFADEATQSAVMEKYASDMAAYNRQEFMKEISPALEFAKQGMREKEKTEIVSVLSQVPELSDIGEMIPQLDKIIANNKWLSSDDMPMDEKYINAYAIAKGVSSMNTPPPAPPKEPDTEELMRLYNNNSDFRALVEKQRIENLKQSQQVPPFSASSGAVNAALNIPKKPKTFDEAFELSKTMFGE